MNSTTDFSRLSEIKSKVRSSFSWILEHLTVQWGKTGRIQTVLKVLSVGFSISALFYLIFHATQTSETTTMLQNKNQSIQRQLNDLNDHLTELEKSKLNARDEVDEEKTRKDILELQKNIASLASTSDVSKISGGLEDLKKHVSEMKKSLDTQNGQLPVSALPFEVQSMDVLNGVAYLTLVNKHQLFTVKSGDSIGEWTVLEIAQNEKNAVFQNVSGEQVIVHLAK